jgi:hypothetical protein
MVASDLRYRRIKATVVGTVKIKSYNISGERRNNSTSEGNIKRELPADLLMPKVDVPATPLEL